MSNETSDWELRLRLDKTMQRNHLQWAREEVMKAGNKIISVLKEVHDKGTYKCDYATFEDYCQKEWGFSRKRAYQLLSGANFKQLMLEAGGGPEVEELSETHLREIQSLLPSEALEVVRQVKKKGKVTRAALQKAVKPDAVLPPSQATERQKLERKIAGALKSYISTFGPITRDSIPKACKEIASEIPLGQK